MRHRVLPLCLAVLFLVALTALPVAAAADTHEGLVVSAGAGKLVMTDNAGKNQHTHDVAFDAKITCDGKDCKLEDLKKGFKVRVTTEKKEGKEQATKLEARKSE